VNAYREIRPHLDTGDLVLFSGKGGISAGIKWFTGCGWSHLGMVLRLDAWDIVLLWETTTLSPLPDIRSGQARQGVQLSPLSERIKTYDGAVAIRHLAVERTPAMLEALRMFREEVKQRPYEEDKVELLRSAYDGPLGDNAEDLSSLFCSELVAEAYQRMGLLPEEPASNEYTPASFCSDEELTLLNGSLGPEQWVLGSASADRDDSLAPPGAAVSGRR